MCPEHIKTHIHLNLTRLPDYASVRSEIETFLEARQSSSNPDAMDIGSLNGQKGVCRNCGQRGHWAASCPNVARVVKVARDRARKASQAKANMMIAKEWAKVAKARRERRPLTSGQTVRKIHRLMRRLSRRLQVSLLVLSVDTRGTVNETGKPGNRSRNRLDNSRNPTKLGANAVDAEL